MHETWRALLRETPGDLTTIKRLDIPKLTPIFVAGAADLEVHAIRWVG